MKVNKTYFILCTGVLSQGTLLRKLMSLWALDGTCGHHVSSTFIEQTFCKYTKILHWCMPLIIGSYNIHVLLHDPFIFGANQAFISPAIRLCYVVLYAQCSTVSSSMAHTSHGTQSATTMETRALSYWLPWQLGCDWLTHSHLYVHGRKGSVSSQSLPHTFTPNFLASDY